MIHITLKFFIIQDDGLKFEGIDCKLYANEEKMVHINSLQEEYL